MLLLLVLFLFVSHISAARFPSLSRFSLPYLSLMAQRYVRRAVGSVSLRRPAARESYIGHGDTQRLSGVYDSPYGLSNDGANEGPPLPQRDHAVGVQPDVRVHSQPQLPLCQHAPLRLRADGPSRSFDGCSSASTGSGSPPYHPARGHSQPAEDGPGLGWLHQPEQQGPPERDEDGGA